MNWSIIADRRSQRNRNLSLRTMVSQALTKSLGENNIPNDDIIKSIIRSSRREYGNWKNIFSMSQVG